MDEERGPERPTTSRTTKGRSLTVDLNVPSPSQRPTAERKYSEATPSSERLDDSPKSPKERRPSVVKLKRRVSNFHHISNARFLLHDLSAASLPASQTSPVAAPFAPRKQSAKSPDVAMQPVQSGAAPATLAHSHLAPAASTATTTPPASESSTSHTMATTATTNVGAAHGEHIAAAGVVEAGGVPSGVMVPHSKRSVVRGSRTHSQISLHDVRARTGKASSVSLGGPASLVFRLERSPSNASDRSDPTPGEKESGRTGEVEKGGQPTLPARPPTKEKTELSASLSPSENLLGGGIERSDAPADVAKVSQPMVPRRSTASAAAAGTRGAASRIGALERVSENEQPAVPKPPLALSDPLLDEGQEGEKEEAGLVGDWAVIFAMVNCMAGAGVLNFPWAYEQSGILGGLLTTLIFAALSLYSCNLVLRSGIHAQIYDFTELCCYRLGSKVAKLTLVMNGVMFVGVIAVYMVFLTNSVFELIETASCWETSGSCDQWWQPELFAVVVTFVIFLLCFVRNLTVVMLLNSFGTFFLIYVVFFCIYKSFEQGVSPHIDSQWHVNEHVALLPGLISASFFIQPVILTLVRSSKNPENALRNTSIAFGINLGLILGVGLVGAIAYTGEGIPQVYLSHFSDSGDIFAFSAKIALAVQLLPILLLLVHTLRGIFFDMIVDIPEGERKPWHAPLHDFVIVGFGGLCAVFLAEESGLIMGWVGAISASVLIYGIPAFLPDTSPLDPSDAIRTVKENERAVSWYDKGRYARLFMAGMGILLLVLQLEGSILYEVLESEYHDSETPDNIVVSTASDFDTADPSAF
eukprot:Rmarinus@m.8267